MTDTPQHIHDLQLQLWLSKSPGERLLQALKNNEYVFLLFKHGREEMKRIKDQQKLTASTPPE
ncbi:MAG TPA: hypothetical protein VF609_04445 [Flavisolibacter sp.]